MAYFRDNSPSYGGLAGIWGRGKLPSITVNTDKGKLILPMKPDFFGDVDDNMETSKLPWYKHFFVEKPYWEKYWKD